MFNKRPLVFEKPDKCKNMQPVDVDAYSEAVMAISEKLADYNGDCLHVPIPANEAVAAKVKIELNRSGWAVGVWDGKWNLIERKHGIAHMFYTIRHSENTPLILIPTIGIAIPVLVFAITAAIKVLGH